MNNAEKVAAIFGNDGMNFESTDGRGFDEVCAQFSSKKERGRNWYDENGDMAADYDENGDMVRYEFPDGSALVVSGDAWDIEGEMPFSWASV